MAWIVSVFLSCLLLTGMLATIVAMLVPRWRMIADILADGSATALPHYNRAPLPLRFAA